MISRKKAAKLIAFTIAVTILCGCAQMGSTGATGSRKKNTKYEYSINGQSYKVLPSSENYLEIGVASWYGQKFHGRLTANGETYDMYQMTAAHKTLPLPTMVKVTNLDNGEKVLLKVNDRGPFHDNRLIDLSYQAALKLGFADKGTAPVVVEAVVVEPVVVEAIGVEGKKENAEEIPQERKNKLIRVASVKSHIQTMALEQGKHNIGYFLQIGAFTLLKSAEHLMEKLDQLIGRHEFQDVNVRILQSESKQKTLHKVWIGPIKDEFKRDMLVSWVQEMELGNPIKVDVD